MQTRVIDLNCKEKEYLFNLSVISEDAWRNFAHAIVLNKGKYVKELQLNGYKVVIRDNKVKFKIFYQDDAYHELEYRIDVLGRASRKYQDDVSVLWRDVMEKYFGEEYSQYVEMNLNKDITDSVDD